MVKLLPSTETQHDNAVVFFCFKVYLLINKLYYTFQHIQQEGAYHIVHTLRLKLATSS